MTLLTNKIMHHIRVLLYSDALCYISNTFQCSTSFKTYW